MKTLTVATILFAALTAPALASADVVLPTTTRTSASAAATHTQTAAPRKHAVKRHAPKSASKTSKRHRKTTSN